MTTESAFIDMLRAIATDPAARGLRDDVAVLPVGDARLILTSDTMVEGVHYLPDDPPDSIGWKLAAVNLSDLAAKGARPRGALLNYALSGDGAWDAAFLSGLRAALEMHDMPLLGGDTVAMPAGAPRAYSLTAIGEAQAERIPDRSGARVGDQLYVTGPVGDAGAGLRLRLAGRDTPVALVEAYRRPRPHLAQGQALASLATAMMDVSDGLLIDAERMAVASGLAVVIDAVPLSADLAALDGDGVAARIAAATAGDDYVLLFALPAGQVPPVPALAIGRFVDGEGMTLMLDGETVPLPQVRGYEHRARFGPEPA